MQHRPYIIVILAVSSIIACCFCSQFLLRHSKQSNLSLNRYYLRKKYEKQRMIIGTIQESHKIRNYKKMQNGASQKGNAGD